MKRKLCVENFVQKKQQKLTKYKQGNKKCDTHNNIVEKIEHENEEVDSPQKHILFLSFFLLFSFLYFKSRLTFTQCVHEIQNFTWHKFDFHKNINSVLILLKHINKYGKLFCSDPNIERSLFRSHYHMLLKWK